MGTGAGAWGSPSRPRTPWRPPATFGLRGFARAGIFIQTGACGLWLCTAALARVAPVGAAALPHAEDGGRVGRAPVFHSLVDPRRGPPRFSAVTDPERPCAGFVRRYVQFSCRLPGSGIPGSRGKSERTFLKRHQPVLHGGCAILRPHQQGTRGPISPRPRQRLIFFFLIIIGIPVGARLFLQPNFS